MSETPVSAYCTRNVITIHKRETMGFVIKTMVKNRFRRFPIIDDENRIQGIITSMDILQGLYSSGDINFLKDEVGKHMTTDVRHLTPDTSIRETVNLMYTNGISGVPIVEDGQLYGIFTDKDIVLLNELWFTISDQFITENEGIGRKLSDEHVVTENFSVWQCVDRMFKLSQRQLVVRTEETHEYTGIISVMKIFEALVSIFLLDNLDIPSLQTTPISNVPKHPLLQRAAPLMVNSARLWMNSRGIEALPLFQSGKLVKLITEKDLVSFIYSFMRT